MNAYQYNELSEKERIICHFRIVQLGDNLQDQDYYEIKRQAEKVNWKIGGKSSAKLRKKDIMKIISETK